MVLSHNKLMGNQILLVDDDVDLLETFKESLSLRGYDIITAHNGHEAVEQYKKKVHVLHLWILKCPLWMDMRHFQKLQKCLVVQKSFLLLGMKPFQKHMLLELVD